MIIQSQLGFTWTGIEIEAIKNELRLELKIYWIWSENMEFIPTSFRLEVSFFPNF